MSPQQLPIKKMKQGMSYSCKEKTIILNVFKYFKMVFSGECVTEIVRRTAKATGCSEKSVFQFRKEEASAEGFREPSKTKVRRNININSRDIKYDQSVRQTIRNIIYELRHRNITPSLNTILRQVRANETLPNFSLMTLRRLMFDMGFYYTKEGSKAVLMEKGSALPSSTPEIKPLPPQAFAPPPPPVAHSYEPQGYKYEPMYNQMVPQGVPMLFGAKRDPMQCQQPQDGFSKKEIMAPPPLWMHPHNVIRH